MKRTIFKWLTALIVTCMILTSIPVAFADGDTPYCKVIDIVDGDGDFYNGEEIFVLEETVYNGSGDIIGNLELGENSFIWSIAGNMIVVEEEIASVDGYTYIYHFYRADDNGIKLLYSFDDDAYYVSPYDYDCPEYAVVTEYSDSPDSYYSKYMIIDDNGEQVYVENSDKIAEYCGSSVFWEYDSETGKYSVFVFFGGPKIYMDVSGDIYEIFRSGGVVTENDDSLFGLRDLNDEVLFEEKYASIEDLDGYYVAYSFIDHETYFPVDGVVIDYNGNKVYETEHKIEFFNGNISVETDTEYNSYIVDVKTGEIIDKGEYYYACGKNDVFVIEKLNDKGNVVAGYAVRADGSLLVNKPVRSVSFDSSSGAYSYYDYDSNGYCYHTASGVEYSYNYDVLTGMTLTTRNIEIRCDGDNKLSIRHGGSLITREFEYFDEFFEMPDCQVLVFSEYNDEKEVWDYTYVILRTSPFNDVVLNNWAYPYVNGCVNRSIMNGTGGGQFSPNMQVSRAQVVTTLWRLVGSPKLNAENSFVDVPDGQWYTDAVTWAADSGITTGVGGSYFAPERAVTRGEVAAIIYRLAAAMGLDTEGKDDLSGFVDTNELADWNRDAFAWCVYSGIITGKSGSSLAPNDTLSRAELAAILMRY